MEKITANMRRLTITTQESGARLREPGKTLLRCRNKMSTIKKKASIINSGVLISIANE